ncbi:hypothetical protein SLS55_010435 [Diplodia seriata]|uniref:Uncharacterized protein n=1 Tax=Diplodia seriata TaxID=420778 RepID=A0ABR3BZ85_9PEZI
MSCCAIGKQKSGILDPVPPNLNCAQTYDPSKTPSPSAFIGFSFCMKECPGIGLSKPKEPGQWAAPIVQFILPSVIFSMTIPRAKQVDFDFIGRFNQSWKHIPISLFRQLWAVVLLLIDTTLWIGAIIIWAAPMMISGLYEGLLDHRVLSWLENQEQGHADKGCLEFLVTVIR